MEEFKMFIMGLDITDNIKEECSNVSLVNYIGTCKIYI
jgi:hypothetical protein